MSADAYGACDPAWLAAHPKNVCPKCGRRAEWELLKRDGRPGAPVRCGECGAVVRHCERRYLTPEERAESDAAKREKARARREARRDERREYDRIRQATDEYRVKHRKSCRKYYATHKDEINAKARAKLREDAEHRAKCNMRRKRWRLRNAEHVRLVEKRRVARKWREERARKETSE